MTRAEFHRRARAALALLEATGADAVTMEELRAEVADLLREATAGTT